MTKWIYTTVFCILSLSFSAQLERVFVETYYISDNIDATDTTGGGVEEGSVTYRIYADLLPGTSILEILGEENHPFEIMSTDTFYNNPEGGTFGNNISKISYESNTVALDSYLAIGQIGFQGTKKFFGIPKNQDDDGSFIGGLNNDGGSEIIDGGLLINDDPLAGLPLTVADGMDTLVTEINDWFSYGILDLVNGNDSTIFGDLKKGTSYISENFSLRNSGVHGVVADSNQVLIAQLTTKGILNYRLNMKVRAIQNGDTTVITYVGTNANLLEGQEFNPYLIYPQECGCTDPLYVEYSPEFVCLEEGSCINLHVSGCTDTLACNYDPNATLNIIELCCYPGFCADRDIEQVCPQLKGDSFDIDVFPNPAETNITLNILSGVVNDYTYSIFNQNGVTMKTASISEADLNYNESIPIDDFSPGIYNIQVRTSQVVQHKIFVVL